MEELYNTENNHYYSFVYKVQTGNFHCQKIKLKIDLSKVSDKYSKVSVFSDKDSRWNTIIEDGYRINTSTTSTTTSVSSGNSTGGMYGASGLGSTSNMMSGGSTLGGNINNPNLVGVNGVSKEQIIQQYLDKVAKLLFA